MTTDLHRWFLLVTTTRFMLQPATRGSGENVQNRTLTLSRRLQTAATREAASLLLLLQLVFDFLGFVVLNEPQDLLVVHHTLNKFSF